MSFTLAADLSDDVVVKNPQISEKNTDTQSFTFGSIANLFQKESNFWYWWLSIRIITITYYILSIAVIKSFPRVNGTNKLAAVPLVLNNE